MPAAIRIKLTAEEDRTLSKLRVAQTVPQRTLLSRPYAATECSRVDSTSNRGDF